MSSFFGGGNASTPQGPEPLFAAKTEMEMYTGMYLIGAGQLYLGQDASNPSCCFS